MITIQQTVDIPADRHLTLEVPLPETVPSGRTSVLLVFPQVDETPAARKPEAPSEASFAPFPSLEELKAEASRKAAEREAAIKATGVDPLQKYCGSLKGFFGEDAVAYQRRIRDEWPD